MSELGQQEQQATLDSEGMDRGISFLGLTWASEASLIGSGWLFGALTAATIAGPSAIIAWAVATVIVGVLALVPVFYVALYGTRRALAAVIVGVAIFYLGPILLIGAPEYPDSQYRVALMAVAVYSIIGLTTQGLVRGVKRGAAEARDRERDR